MPASGTLLCYSRIAPKEFTRGPGGNRGFSVSAEPKDYSGLLFKPLSVRRKLPGVEQFFEPSKIDFSTNDLVL